MLNTEKEVIQWKIAIGWVNDRIKPKMENNTQFWIKHS